MPPGRTIPDYFWSAQCLLALPSAFDTILSRFAKIIYFNQRRRKVHVQWFEHSSKTLMQECATVIFYVDFTDYICSESTILVNFSSLIYATTKIYNFWRIRPRLRTISSHCSSVCQGDSRRIRLEWSLRTTGSFSGPSLNSPRCPRLKRCH